MKLFAECGGVCIDVNILGQINSSKIASELCEWTCVEDNVGLHNRNENRLRSRDSGEKSKSTMTKGGKCTKKTSQLNNGYNVIHLRHLFKTKCTLISFLLSNNYFSSRRYTRTLAVRPSISCILSFLFTRFSYAICTDNEWRGKWKVLWHKLAVVCIPWSFITTQWVYAIRERFAMCRFSSRFQPLEIRFFVVFFCLDEVSTLHLVHYHHWQLAFYHTLVCVLPLYCVYVCVSQTKQRKFTR